MTKGDVEAAVAGNGARARRPTQPAAGTGESVIRGPAATLVRFMEESRSIPTATSFRTLSVDVLDARRRQLKAAGRKLSFTHLIAWAIVQAGEGHAGHGPLLRRGRRQAQSGDPRRREPRPRRGRGAQGRHPRARGARDPRRGHAWASASSWPPTTRLVAGARDNTLPPDAYSGRPDHAHQPGRHRHRGVGAAADARAGHDRGHRRDRLSAGPGPGRPGTPDGARRGEGHDDDLHLRPPRHPGRGVRAPSSSASTSCSRAPTASTRSVLRRSDVAGAAGGETPDDAAITATEPAPARRGARGRGDPRRGAAPGGAGRDLGGQGPPHARAPGGASSIRSAAAPRGDPALDPEVREPHARADGADPGLGAAGGGAGRHLRRGAPPPGRHLHGHDRLRDRAHRRPQPPHLAAPDDRVRRVPQAARPEEKRRRLLDEAVGGRGPRELPAQGVPRKEAVLDRGPRRARADARRDDRALRAERRARGGPRHGPPRPAERARPHGRPPLPVDPGGVRGRADALGGHRRARGRHGRREVPLRRLGHLHRPARARA